MGSDTTPGRSAANMIRKANDQGGRDNITAIVVEYADTIVDTEETFLDDETVDMTTEWFEDDLEDTVDT